MFGLLFVVRRVAIATSHSLESHLPSLLSVVWVPLLRGVLAELLAPLLGVVAVAFGPQQLVFVMFRCLRLSVVVLSVRGVEHGRLGRRRSSTSRADALIVEVDWRRCALE